MLKSSLSFKAINKVLFTVKIPPVALMPSLSHTHIHTHHDRHSSAALPLGLQADRGGHEIDMKPKVV